MVITFDDRLFFLSFADAAWSHWSFNRLATVDSSTW